MPGIGLVLRDDSMAARIRGALEESGLPIAFEVTPEELENDDLPSKVDIVVVAATLHPRGDSVYGKVRERLQEERIILCSRPATGQTLRRAIDLGIDGVVWDTRLEETLGPTVRAVHAGQLVVPPDVRRRTEPPVLTNREKQVLSLVIMGLTNREIAQQLFVSESTVKSHLNTAYRKLGVHSRAEATRVIADPDEGLGTGILAITGPGHARGRSRDS